MVTALVRDLLAAGDCEVSVLRDPTLPTLGPGLRPLRQTPEGQLPTLEACLADVDAVWPIAPERGGCLEFLCREVENQGKRLLSTPAVGVRVTASKEGTLKRLRASGLATVASRRLDLSQPPDPVSMPFPWVVKPDDGVGCEDTMVISDPSALSAFTRAAAAGPWLVQPLLQGRALSLSALFKAGEARLLAVNAMKVRREGQAFMLQGLTVNLALAGPLFQTFERLLRRIARVFPELWGYAGIDFLWDGQTARLLEINPRLTSAYIGLAAALGHNPARWVLETATTGHLPNLPQGPRGGPVDIDWQSP